MLYYTVSPNPNKHQWEICLTLRQEKALSLEFSLPNWVPGSYLIRDFSRHIIEINAWCNDRQTSLIQTSKNTWKTPPLAGEWRICYTVYAFDLSVRGAFLTTERGFFDGACLFLKASGFEHFPHQVSLQNLPHGWKVATTLPRIGSDTHHNFQTASYAELIDHPVETGNIEILHFSANNIPHRIALSGHYADFDRTRFIDDIRKICQAELAMFPEPAPFEEYLFLLHVGDNIYGGLEHISSTALLADRNCLPLHNTPDNDENYVQLLGLCSHEYFHAWNVKSVKPEAFAPYDLDQECYTEQLWAFEGITSYYDDLFLVRSGVITPETYLNLLAKNLTRVQQGKGRLKQTLAESSFTAWNKYYKQNENSPNSIVSYYQKGALAALCLDLIIREKSNGLFSLDTVMQQHYRDWQATRKGIPEKQWQQRCQEITGLDLNEFFQTALYSTHDLPLTQCLSYAGIDLQWHALTRSHGGAYVCRIEPQNSAGDFGARFKQNSDGITLSHVFHDGSAERAGLCTNDKIIALNRFACTDFTAQWSKLNIGDTVHIHFFRDGVLHETELTIQAAEADTALLQTENPDKLADWLFNRNIQTA
ncbi:M61 family metallopeptidase [Neisseria weaveri]|uniref:Peptidase M61 n=1 Tax=Neisseria weaveri TaxID=28091 RepID=A0A3S5B5G6_9NEIS|nr:PDZ domain-containing protein [Neisseria weaveri]EGV37409.1 hypothetical protein l11_11620 [Neisseria weaveri LMG 5135]VEJ51604.1 peptidase M61 [Neisseria weaveri]